VSITGDPFSADLAKSKKIEEVKAEQTLLDVLREVGFGIPNSYEVGNCEACWVGIRGGRVVHRGTGLLGIDWGENGESEGRVGRRVMLSCVSRGWG
jgi:ferredoxin